MGSIICPICNSLDTQIMWPLDFNADGLLDKPFWLHKCNTCGSGITAPIPAPEELDSYYKTGIYLKSGGYLNTITNFLLFSLQYQRLREIRSHLGFTGNLLDIGSGKGRFLKAAVNKGWVVKGIEPSPTQAESARLRYGLNIYQGRLEDANLDTSSYDVLTAWHVLEHMPDPHSFLKEVSRLVRPGGVFVCEVPNFDSWQALLTRNHWFQLDAPRHLIHYTGSSLTKVLENNSFAVIEVKTSSLELGLMGMLQSLMNKLGFPPNMFFCLLKKSIKSPSHADIFMNILAAIIFTIPAIILETSAVVLRKGGVLRVIAVRRQDDTT